jgi:DNA topoisomerase-1
MATSKALVIVESPAKAKTIEKYLGKGFDVRASVGHIMDLPKNDLGVELKNRTFEPELVVSPGKEKVVEQLKKAAAKADEIYLAPDPDREGEAIAYHLALQLGTNAKERKKIRRVTFNEITKKAVQEAFTRIWWMRSRRGGFWIAWWGIRFLLYCGIKCGAGYRRGACKPWRCG